MGQGNKFARTLQICLGITALLVTIFLVVSILLFLTILKPKQPKIITQDVTLEVMKFIPLPFRLNVTFGVVVTIDNCNYGSFKFENSTAYVSFRRSTVVAEAPIEEDTIPARGKHDISTTVVLLVDTLPSSPFFGGDVAVGRFNFTSSTTLHGKATVLKFLKIKATTYSVGCGVPK